MRETMFRLFGRSGPNRRRKASVLVFVLMIVGILSLVLGSILSGARTQLQLSQRYQIYTEEFSIAEFQLTKAFAEISYALKKAGEVDPEEVVEDIVPAVVPGYTIDSVRPFSITLLSDEMSLIPAGEKWSGYNLRRLSYRIKSGLVKRVDGRAARYKHPGVELQQDMQITYVPLHIFGIFYDNDLELHPGADFEENGRVHTNSDFYYGADGKKMDIKNYLSAAGNINYGRHKNSGKGLAQGKNSFWDGAKSVNTQQDGINVDSTYNHDGKNWALKASELWSQYVRDRSMGVPRFNLPWPDVVPNITIIQPPAQTDFGPLLTNKFCYMAGLRIVKENGVVSATTSAGTAVELVYTKNGKQIPIVSTGSFYNERENGIVNVLDIDLQKLGEAGIAPTNGIVYIDNKDAAGSVRLINAADLPGNKTLGFTITTPDALYVQGDYNSVNKTLSMLAADSINILSAGWKDSENSDSGKRDKTPHASSNLTMNAVVVAGNVPTTVDGRGDKRYSGGVENFFRYLEKWEGSKEHRFSGSIINLYRSDQNLGHWDVQKYSPPKRVWSWDTALAKRGPPGSPNTFDTARVKWTLYAD